METRLFCGMISVVVQFATDGGLVGNTQTVKYKTNAALLTTHTYPVVQELWIHWHRALHCRLNANKLAIQLT